MIPKLTPKVLVKTETKANIVKKDIPEKEIIITTKNGKARIQDVYIGGFPRTSLIDVLRDLFETYFT